MTMNHAVEHLPVETIDTCMTLLHAEIQRAHAERDMARWDMLHEEHRRLVRYSEALGRADAAQQLPIARDPRRPGVVCVRGRWIDCPHAGMPMCVDALRNGGADARQSGFVPSDSPKANDGSDAARIAYRKAQRAVVNAKNRFAKWLDDVMEEDALPRRVRRLVVDRDLMVRETR